MTETTETTKKAKKTQTQPKGTHTMGTEQDHQPQALHVVVGGQFGSEAKGHVTHRIIRHSKANPGRRIVNVRVAGPNAGHTVITDSGQPLALRAIPVGAATPGADLVIAPGSEIDLSVLYSEIAACAQAGEPIDGRLMIHPEATVLTPNHIAAETNVELIRRIGSTGKGIGAARADRIMRTASRVADLDQDELDQLAAAGATVLRPDTYSRIMSGYDVTVIEGTQGYGLGLHAGFYPQCTSSDCRAIDFMAMAGLSPWQYDETTVWVALRPYPIRVAGNSGPLRGETSWRQLSLRPEKTTVTQKTRRVGTWDPQLARDAVQANGARAVRLALTMADQVDPRVEGCTDSNKLLQSGPVRDWVIRARQDAGAPVALVTTSANTGVFL